MNESTSRQKQPFFVQTLQPLLTALLRLVRGAAAPDGHKQQAPLSRSSAKPHSRCENLLGLYKRPSQYYFAAMVLAKELLRKEASRRKQRFADLSNPAQPRVRQARGGRLVVIKGALAVLIRFAFLPTSVSCALLCSGWSAALSPSLRCQSPRSTLALQ